MIQVGQAHRLSAVFGGRSIGAVAGQQKHTFPIQQYLDLPLRFAACERTGARMTGLLARKLREQFLQGLPPVTQAILDLRG